MFKRRPDKWQNIVLEESKIVKYAICMGAENISIVKQSTYVVSAMHQPRLMVECRHRHSQVGRYFLSFKPSLVSFTQTSSLSLTHVLYSALPHCFSLPLVIHPAAFPYCPLFSHSLLSPLLSLTQLLPAVHLSVLSNVHYSILTLSVTQSSSSLFH